MENILEARVYVGTYGKYSNGSIFGKWLDLSEIEDKVAFLVACRELHSDEGCSAEFMFQDWENIPSNLISECWISEHFFTLRNTIQELPECEQEPFMVWFENGGYDLDTEDIKDLVSSFHDEYHGEYSCEEDFAAHLVEECYSLPEFALNYFDYQKFSRDLFCSNFSFDSGFVFRRA